MKNIYKRAQKVQVWLGPDNDEHHAEVAVQSIKSISDFLCERLEINISERNAQDNTYQEELLKNKYKLPWPSELSFSSDIMWKALLSFYRHKYFTRIWTIQEISANTRRVINMGSSTTDWNRVDLVASYIIMDSAFAEKFGFSDAYCWWVVTVAEMIAQPDRWLNILYLASNYGCLDTRDVIYGLRGLMNLAEGGSLILPDYRKPREQVYRDTVEAALIDFKKTDVLLYVTGMESPSWIPRWDIPMLFRNPFRFGKPVPWKAAGSTNAVWSIDRDSNVLSLLGSIVDVVQSAQTYNQRWFSNETIDSEDGKVMLGSLWTIILQSFGRNQRRLPLTESFLAAAAVSPSFGEQRRMDSALRHKLLINFIAYLAITIGTDSDIIRRYIPTELLEEVRRVDGRCFGKPVWDFQYPDASIFVTRDNLVGCAIAPSREGDVVFVASGSTYPMILRPEVTGREQTTYTIRGFSYVDGIMDGERRDRGMSHITIR